eukprot:Skav211418  [mRNA]  locus=scaffold1608:169373:170209:+ [translate_table: standard]
MEAWRWCPGQNCRRRGGSEALGQLAPPPPRQEAQDREALKAEGAKLNINRLSHPNIVKVLAIVQGEGLVAGTLLELLGHSLQARRKTGDCRAEIRQACSDVGSGLAHTPARLLAHHDVNSRNIKKGKFGFKLIDLDAALQMNNADATTSAEPGAMPHWSPEVLMGIPQSPFKSNCYLFGHTFADLGCEMHEYLHCLTSLHDLARVVISCHPLLLPADARASMKDALAEMGKKFSITNPVQFSRVILEKLIQSQGINGIDAPNLPVLLGRTEGLERASW